MMFVGGRDGFLADLNQRGRATVTYTASDDLAIVIDAIRGLADQPVRIWPSPQMTLTVQPRT